MIERPQYKSRIETALGHNPVVALLGPRQCCKTTLSRIIASQHKCEYFDLEDPVDLSRLSSPMLTLGDLSGLVVIDEVQRKPELFEVLRVLVDRPQTEAKFLLLGSASPHLVRGVSESLAGRLAFVDMSGFDVREIGLENFKKLWFRGSFPRSYLAPNDSISDRWRNDFIKTFLERDIPQLGISVPALTLRRFWTMIAHYHGQVWNAAQFARSLSRSEATARRYLDILSGAFVIRQVQPWYENLRKRQVKSPKLYIRDSGLLHTLLSLPKADGILMHPKLGASWEGFAIEQVLALTERQDAYFWATHAGAELDLLIFKNGKRLGFEIKYTDAPKITKSMRIAFDDLKLDKIYIIYPGRKSYLLDKHIHVKSILDIESI